MPQKAALGSSVEHTQVDQQAGWVRLFRLLVRMAGDTRHSDTLGLLSYKRRQEANHAFIYLHTFVKAKASFILLHTSKILLFLKHVSLLCYGYKDTMWFVLPLMQRSELTDMLVLLQLKCCTTDNLLTHTENWNSFISLYLWAKRPKTSTTTLVMHSWFIKSHSTSKNYYYNRNARTLTQTVWNRNLLYLYNLTKPKIFKRDK